MRTTLAVACVLLGSAAAAPWDIFRMFARDDTPAGCSESHDGPFEITVTTVTKAKRSVFSRAEKRGECGANGILVMSLADGMTKDSVGRTGYIADNYQFQFDAPPQAGAIITSGFSVCKDNILALGSEKTFYRCLSGTFYNLYTKNWAAQCEPVNIIVLPCGSDDMADQGGDGQVVGTTVVATTIVTALSDGQPQVITTSISVPVTSYSPTTTAVPVSQYSDGQIQVTPPGTASTPAATTPAATTPAGSVTLPTETVPVTTPSESASETVTLPTESAPSATTSESTSASTSGSSATTTPESSSPAATTSAPATTSSPVSSGSSRLVVGSVGALAVTLFAFACL